MSKKPINKRIQKGFTLVEIVIAIALIGLLLTGVIAVLAPAADDIDDAVVKKEARSVIEQFVAEMSIIRGEGSLAPGVVNKGQYDQYAKAQSKYENADTPYKKAYTWCDYSNDVNENEAVFVYYNYVDPKKTTAENHFNPININTLDLDKSTKGIDYIIESRVRRRHSDEINTYRELEGGFTHGKAFLIRFKGYKPTAKGWELDDYGEITPIGEYDGDNLGMMFMVQAEVYKMRTNYVRFITNSSSNSVAKYKDEKGKIRPIYKTNLTFYR